MPKKIRRNIISLPIPQEVYGEEYRDHLMDQYKIYLSSIENTNTRRQQANQFFMGLNAGLFALVGLIHEKFDTNQTATILFAALAGLIISYSWYRIMHSYSLRVKTKFEILYSIERNLPMPLFETEWRELSKSETKYHPVSNSEIWVPLVFMVLYLMLTAYVYISPSIL